MADPAVRRTGLLAMADVARAKTGTGTARPNVLAAVVVLDLEHCHSSLLCCRSDVRSKVSFNHGRVLALVGSAPLGGRFLRSVRHGGDCVPADATQTALDDDSHPQRALLHRHLPLWRHRSEEHTSNSSHIPLSRMPSSA